MKIITKAALILGGAALLAAGTNACAAETHASFYGTLDLWAGSQEKPTDNGSTAQLGSGGMTTSFLGAKATMDLPNNVQGIAAVEMFFRPDTGQSGRYSGDEFFARSAYVGFKGNLGEVKFGRVTAPYYLPVVFSNPFGGSFVFSPAILQSFQGGDSGPIVGDSGWSNAISYSTPNMGGVNANLVYAFGEKKGQASQNRVGGNVVYRHGGFMGTLSAFNVKQGAINGDLGALPNPTKQTGYLAGASYDFSVVKLYGMYQRLNTGTLSGDIDIDTYQGGVSAPVGPGSVLASYAKSAYSGADNNDRDTWAVGYDYPVNQQLDFYAVFLRDHIDNTGSGNTYGVGTRLSF